MTDIVARALALKASNVNEATILSVINRLSSEGYVQTGATPSQAQQILQNKTDIASIIAKVATTEEALEYIELIQIPTDVPSIFTCTATTEEVLQYIRS